jgi:uncharacterized protein (DUF1800 family)
MDKHVLWSLRLGFSSKQAAAIGKSGLNGFLQKSFESSVDRTLPNFLEDAPKSPQQVGDFIKLVKSLDPETALAEKKKQSGKINDLRDWWLRKMISDDLPLREKMTCFWHNHYVASSIKISVNYYVYVHNMTLRENAFGNFRTLTKQMLRTNALVNYLDNNDNRKGKINENLSRELLELFTLGIGNYTEADIKNGGKALAGLGPAEDGAIYHPKLEDNDPITYLGKTGVFKADDIVDIIFEQPQIPYFLTRKILKWFIYDIPDEKLVRYYGDYFRKVDFEIKPLLTKIFIEESDKENAGSKIKNPLEFSLQLLHEMHAEEINLDLVSNFLKRQGMDLFAQPNVKGWDGGRAWLTSQILIERNQVADRLCSAKKINGQKIIKDEATAENATALAIDWDRNGDNKDIIAGLCSRLFFHIDEKMQADFESLLKHDFDPQAKGAQDAVLRLFNSMIKTPEFQLI